MHPVVSFTLLFMVSEALLSLFQFLLRKKAFSGKSRFLIILGKLILAVLFAFLPMAGPVQLRFLQPLMIAAYAALFADGIADALLSVIFALKKQSRSFGVVKTFSLICSIFFLTYGVWNMETVSPNYHTYKSEKLDTSHTVVFIADLHVGSAQPFSVTEQTIREIGALQADATIIGGDFVDDYTTKEEMENVCRLFSDYSTPIYYVYGNHDRQGHAKYAGGQKFTQEELETALTANGVVILKDAFAEIAPDLLLFGREDVSEGDRRIPVDDLTNPAGDRFLIVADHQPTRFKENLALGTDLQLSGHTHAGQLFPLGALYDLIGYNYGDYQEGSAIMNVSAGACGWRAPFRNERRCHYEVVKLEPSDR